jgi:8-hydroxy-5-deazaflavin:NADPH oxidoreductase
MANSTIRLSRKQNGGSDVDMASIAVLGSGRVGSSLAPKLAAAGHDVVVGSRDPDASADKFKESGVRVATIKDALAASEVVINATPGDTALERFKALRDELAEKVLIDVSNATIRGPSGAPGGLVYPNGSLAEELHQALPETKVVKTLNHVVFMVMTNPGTLSLPATAFISGDYESAKETTRQLLNDLGWPDEQVMDLGDISTARGTEALILLVGPFMMAKGMVPCAVTMVT